MDTDDYVRSKTVFVSGHMDLTEEEFALHYAPRLREAAERDARFVVGDAPGCDYMAQKFLASLRINGGDYDYRPDITVYHMLERPRCLFNNPNSPLDTRGGFKSDDERDAAMTAASEDDIAWVRPGNKKGYGTRNNLKRRESVRHERDRALRKTHPRFVIEHDWAEYPIIRVKPATDQDLAFAREHNVPGYCVPIPPELSARYAQALAREREASAAVASIEQEIRSYECKQESDPV